VAYQAESGLTLTGMLDLVGMDQGGGEYTTAGPVDVSGNLSTLGDALSITGSGITLENGSGVQPIVISTSSATGSAGALTLTAPAITVGTYDQLLARGNSSSGDGSITLTAMDTDAGQTGLSLANQLADLLNPNFSATISIDEDAVINGGDVTLTTTSGDNSLLSNASTAGELAASLIGTPTAEYLNQFLPLPISALITNATSTAEIGQDATISSSGSLTVSSTATANSTGEATYWYQSLFGVLAGSFVFSKANSNAQALVDSGATITATGGVSIESSTTTTTSGTAQVTQNTGSSPTNGNNVQLSGDYNNLSTISHAIVSQSASVMSPRGNVQVSATADDNNDINVQTASYQDGSVGLTGAGSDVNADVQAYVDGTIVAGGLDVGSPETINPFLSTTFAAGQNNFRSANQIDYANSQFVFDTNPGYTTGEPLVYSSGLGGAIRGLANNTTYYAIVSNNGTLTSPPTQYDVRLAATASDASTGTFLSFGQYPTIDGIPITDVNTSASEMLFDFDPGFTEGQTVTVTPVSGQFLGYDNSDGSLAGPLSDTYTVHIVSSTIDSTDQYTIQLLDSSGNTVQLDDSPYLETTAGRIIRIQQFNVTAKLVTLNPADLASGSSPSNRDPLTYHQGLGTDVTGLSDGTTYYAIVDPNDLPTLQLAATLDDALSAYAVTQDPTLTWTVGNNQSQATTISQVQTALPEELIGPAHSFTILSSDSTTNILTVAEQPGASVTALTEGELLTYEGAIGSGSTLQDGKTYSVHIIDQSNPNAIQLQLQDTLRLPTLGTLTATGGAGQSFTIDEFDAGSDLLTVALSGTSPFTPLTQGETVIYHGASIAGYLRDGQSYFVSIVDQTDPLVIQVQLAPNYPVTQTGTLVGTGHSFTIISSDPDSSILTLAESAGATVANLTQGETLTYQGPSIASAGYLQDYQQYTVDIIDQSDLSAIEVQLVSASNQVGSSGLLKGTGQSFSITDGDSSTGIITIAEQPQSESTALTEGETLLYEGPSASGANTLQDGQTYTVHVIDQSNPGAIQIQLNTTAQQAGYGTLVGTGGSYVIHQADASTGILTLSQVGSAEALTDGGTQRQ